MSEGIPDGHVEIEIVIDEKGEYKAEIVGHGKNSSCKGENDDKLLSDLLDGELGEADDWGKTEEDFEGADKTSGLTNSDTENKKFGGKDFGKNKKSKDKLDLGYGV